VLQEDSVTGLGFRVLSFGTTVVGVFDAFENLILVMSTGNSEAASACVSERKQYTVCAYPRQCGYHAAGGRQGECVHDYLFGVM
jgi:hypothetical protein